MIYQTTTVTATVTGTVTADTETPAAAVLADNTANPSTTLIGSCLMVYDGSTWDRAPGNSTDGVLVNLGANNDVTVNNTTSTPVYTQSNITGIAHGSKTVATAGTDEALASSTACKKVTIEAYAANTGQIAVGGSGVDATAATGTGITLSARDSVTIDIDNLADIFIDSTVNGEGVRYTYFT